MEALTIGDAAIAAIGIVLGLFEARLYLAAREHRESLWVSVICFSAAIYSLLIAIHYNAGPGPALWLTRFEGVSLIVLVHALPMFATAFTGVRVPPPNWAIAASCAIWTALCLSPWLVSSVAPQQSAWLSRVYWRRPVTPLLTVSQLWGLFIAAGSIAWLIRHRRRRPGHARYWVAPLVLWAVTALFSFVAGWLERPLPASLVEYGFFAFAFGLVAKDASEHLQMLEEAKSATRAAESRREVAEALYREIVESVTDGIVLLDDANKVRTWNSVMAALTGVSPVDAIGGSLSELLQLDEHGRAELASHIGLAREGEETTSVDLRLEDDRRITCTLIPFRSRGKRSVLAALRDETEKRELLARMMDMDRMVAVGTLAAGIGHEINNPLAYVLVNLEEAERQLTELTDADVQDVRDLLHRSTDGARRIRDIVASLRSFSRAEERRRPVNLTESLRAAIRMSSNEIRHRAQLVEDLHTSRPVMANPGRLGQVFVNLLINAAQALPEGEKGNTITVRATDHGDDVVCEVTDTGRGLDAASVEKIFEPFYTTKPVGEGTGLGLSIARDTVQALGGRIEVESELGRGTTFRVVLPACESQAVERTMTMPTPDAPRARVLLVDDEPELLQALRRALRLDLDLDTCQSAGEALERLDTGERYDVIVSDLMMPRMSGIELYDEVKERYPQQAETMLFMTGGAFTTKTRAFFERHKGRMLDKPIGTAELRARIAAAIIGQRQAPGAVPRMDDRT